MTEINHFFNILDTKTKFDYTFMLISISYGKTRRMFLIL